MTDASNQPPPPEGGGSGTALPSFHFASFKGAARRGDIYLALGVIGILSVLLLPVPTMLLDILVRSLARLVRDHSYDRAFHLKTS